MGNVGKTGIKPDHQSVSVIIPTLNGEKWLDSLLDMLHQQTRKVDEILIIDSSSKDGSREIARKHNAKVIIIQPDKFDHGATRNYAGRLAKSDILLYMTQDAVPADIYAIERLIDTLNRDERTAAVFGRQLPTLEANLFSEHLRLFNYPASSYIRCWQDRHDFGFKTIFISNSFAAYKKKILEDNGYFPDKLLFGEDTCMVANLLEKGYCVAYDSDACVYHSHNYTIIQDLRRYFDIGVFHVCQSELLKKFGSPSGAGRRYVLDELSFLCTRKKYWLIPESLLRNIGKFLAYNMGKRYKLLPHCLALRCSLNSNWWY